jgi:hypothetical protein
MGQSLSVRQKLCRAWNVHRGSITAARTVFRRKAKRLGMWGGFESAKGPVQVRVGIAV